MTRSNVYISRLFLCLSVGVFSSPSFLFAQETETVEAPAGDTAAESPAPEASEAPIIVTTDNFIRAESDLYFSAMVNSRNALGTITHDREMAALDKQTIIRLNRDTLYSAAIYDLQAGPIKITVPEANGRFLSLQVFNQDHYTLGVHYKAGVYEYDEASAGTRYVMLGWRVLANPLDPEDMKEVHAVQDQMQVEQAGGPGEFVIPNWDGASQKDTRDTLIHLGNALPDTRKMFGNKEQVDPVRHLLGSAMAWGGNPEEDAFYLNRSVPKNDGKARYELIVKDVPVDGFWSISVYNDQGYYTPNDLNTYTLNNLTAQTSEDGSVRVQFGGCDGVIPNCLPIPETWNWMVRLYRPQAAVLDGSWTFPEPVEMP